MGKKLPIFLSLIGILSAIFLIAIRDYTVLDFETFAYLIALVRIPSFFVLLFLFLSLVLMGSQVAGKRLFTFGLFLPSAIVPYLFHILSFVFFPDFITPNTRDKASWLYLTSSAFTVLALSVGVFYSKLSFLQKRPKLYALLSFMISSVISFLVVLYYPYLPKAYQPGFGSTPVRDVFDLALLVWALLITYNTIKHRPFGYNASQTVSVALIFFSLSLLLPIFYVAFTDFLIVASTVYRLIFYLLLAYAILVLQKINVSKNILKDAMTLLSSIAEVEPRTEVSGVVSFSLGKAMEEGFLKSVSIYSAKDGRLLACFHDLKDSIQEPYQLSYYSWMLAKGEGYIVEDQHFKVFGDYILISKGQFDKEDPVLHTHLLNVETLLYSHFSQYAHFNELLQEKSKELNRLYLLLETSEYTTQAYNNIETFSKQVLDRLDQVLHMDGSLFYMLDKNAEKVEKLIISSMFLKNFREEDPELLIAEVQANPNIFDIKDNSCFAKFEHGQYQVGVVGVKLKEPFDKVDLAFFKTISNQLFHIVRLMKVIEDLQSAQLSIEFLSEYDPLTMLYNRKTFERYIKDNIQISSRTGSVFSMVLIDIDNFKLINDVYGHQTADMVLKELSERLKGSVRKMDIPARFGGDEFAVLLPYLSRETARAVAQRLTDKLSSEPMKIEDRNISLSLSAVVVSYPQDGTSAEELITYAEYLMREAKRRGKGIILSSEDVPHRFSVVKELERSLVESIEKSSVIPYYHEIIDLKSMSLFGFEVLMRIKFNDRILSAGEFVDVAERLGAMPKLDLLLMEKVFESYKLFENQVFIFINMVPENATVEFAEKVRALADKYSVPTSNIVFEITERKAIEDIMQVANFVRELKNEGFRFAIDDFGSGYSSFYYLKYLPADFLKIEGEFIKHLTHSHTDRIFIKSIVNVAKEMGIKTIAEFVENDEILEVVKELGIDYAQGYHFGKPEPLEEKLKKFSSKE